MNIPCVKKRGLKIFAPTADQRHALGDDIFLRTHYPISYRRYRGPELTEVWNEKDILNLLNENNNHASNRVFVLFGAAGSGKSESIRWLEHQVKVNDDFRKTFRISRTELDPVYILNRLVQLTGETMSDSILRKWESLKKKPVSLANTLVWDALNAMLESDEDIIPLSYKIRPLVESSLRRSFHKNNRVHKLTDNVELLSLEEWEAVKRDCVVDFNLEYEHFRKRLIDRFEEEVLGGYDFIAALGEVGNKILKSTGKRPLLFVDDLVQSMSIYSSDLLDYFITLEEGSWDIVIGLTPASFENSKRGKELLERVNYLDTFDDRIYKLWLTDEFGEESYTLDSDTVKDYLSMYMAEYKRINKYNCGESCSNYSKCINLHWNNNDVILTPLNEHLVQRIYSNLFKGKGFSRHIIVTIAEFLSAIITESELEFLTERIKREKSTDIECLKTKVLVESYIPLDVNGTFDVPKNFYKALGLKGKQKDTIQISNLNHAESEQHVTELPLNKIELKPDLEAIRDWLEAKKINKELLRKLRLSVYSFLREFLPLNSIVRANTSRPQGSIKYEKYIEGCRLPLSFEGVDDHQGLVIEKSIGIDVYNILNIKEVDDIAQFSAINKLISRREISNLFNEVDKISNEWVQKLENIICMKCYELAFLMYVFVFHIYAFDKYPLFLKSKYTHASLLKLPPKWEQKKLGLSEKAIRFVEEMFKDWFQLRENLYDANLLKQLTIKYPSLESVLEAIVQIQVIHLPKEYKVGNNFLRDMLSEVYNSVLNIFSIITTDEFRSDCERMFLELIDLSQLRRNDLEDITERIEILEQQCLGLGRVYSFLRPPESNGVINLPKSAAKLEIVSLLAKETNNPLFIWSINFKEQLIKVCVEYEALISNYQKNNKSTDDLFMPNMLQVEKLDLNSLLSLAEECVENSDSIMAAINHFDQVSEYIELDYIAHVEDLMNFLNYFQNFISPSDQKCLDLKYVIELGNKYLLLVKSDYDIGQLSNNKSLLIQTFNLLSKKRIWEIKKYACIAIQKNMETVYYFTDSKIEPENKYDALFEKLNKISDGLLKDYAETHEMLMAWRLNIDKIYNNVDNGLSNSTNRVLKKMIKGEKVSLSAKDYWFFKEIEFKQPYLIGKIALEVSLKQR